MTFQEASFNVNLGLNEIRLNDGYSKDFNDFIDDPFNDVYTLSRKR